MLHFGLYFLTAMTFVAVASSIELVLDNTEEQKQNWFWIIKDPQLPLGASGVSLNAKISMMSFNNYTEGSPLIPLRPLKQKTTSPTIAKAPVLQPVSDERLGRGN